METQHSEGFVNTNGTRIYYQEAGSGHPLVLVHAGVADHTMWDAQFELFAQKYRVIRYDLRGFGASAMPPIPFRHIDDLHALLDALGVARTYLVGVSMGGSTVIDYTLTHPARVAAIVPTACGIQGMPSDDSVNALFAKLQELYDAKEVEPIVEEELRLWLVGPRRDPALVSDALKEHFRRMERRNLEQEFAGEEGEFVPTDPKAYTRIHEIAVPTLYIAGAEDFPNVVQAAAIFPQRVAGAQAVVLKNVAHMVPMEAPEEFNRLVLDFLAQADA